MLASLRKMFAAREGQAPLEPARASADTDGSVDATPSTAPGLTYAVGDVHGRADLLAALVVAISDDRETLPEEPATLVLLGDLIDRGPDSAMVLDQVLALQADPRFTVVALRGNHEDALLRFLEEPGFGANWIQFGGGATLRSYGVAPPGGLDEDEAWEAARAAFLEALPPEHLDLLRGLRLTFSAGDYLFVHAGVRPGVPLELQSPQDLLWIRHSFLSSPRAGEQVVVHGHTPAEAPELHRWRIGVDTGAYATGVLTAVRLFGTERRILQVGAERLRAPG